MADDLARGGSKQPLEAKQTTAQSWADVDPDLDTEAISDPGSSSTSGTVSQNNMLHQSSDTEDLQTELGALTVDHGTSNCDDHPSLDQAPPTDRNGSPSLVRETPLSSKPRHESIHERRRREHEEYKQKRAADPSFVPNRGAFFMHDHRHSGAGANGFRPLGRGLNPGRAVVGGPFSPAK